MNLSNILALNGVEQCNNLIDLSTLDEIQEELGVTFGAKLKEYVLKCGYLAYESIEMYGINSRQNKDSDMISQTRYLNEYYPITIGYVALENQGDGLYYIVDSHDMVIEFDTFSKNLTATNKSLWQYIYERFTSAFL